MTAPLDTSITKRGYLSRLERVETELRLMRESLDRMAQFGRRMEERIEFLNQNIVTHILSGSVWVRVPPDGPNAGPPSPAKTLGERVKAE